MKTNGTRITLIVILLIVAVADYYLFQASPSTTAPSGSSLISGSNHLFVSLFGK